MDKVTNVFKLALAVLIVRNKPPEASFQDYCSTVLRRLVDPVEFWKERYDDVTRQLRTAQEKIASLSKTLDDTKKARSSEHCAVPNETDVLCINRDDSMDRFAQFYTSDHSLLLRATDQVLTKYETFATSPGEIENCLSVIYKNLTEFPFVTAIYIDRMIPAIVERLHTLEWAVSCVICGLVVGIREVIQFDVINKQQGKLIMAYAAALHRVSAKGHYREEAIRQVFEGLKTTSQQICRLNDAARLGSVNSCMWYIFILRYACATEPAAKYEAVRHDLERVLFGEFEQEYGDVVRHYCLVQFQDECV
ncbi:hypothetical protein V1514DRAFT_333619 [Lipomyces japonicus]|uniref:uncharacterized protein n=1 Tax=Lipomyces japonicus TaxID=56871 RepID=UPI0034CDC763